MTYYYTAVIIATVFSALIMLIALCNNNFIPKERKHGFLLTFFMIIIVSVAEWMGVFLDHKPEYLIALHRTAKYVEFCITPAIPVVCSTALGNVKLPKWIYAFIIGNIVLQTLSLRFAFIFYITPDNVYTRQPYYFLYIISFIVCTCFLFGKAYLLSKQYQNRSGFMLLLILFFVSAGIGAQIINREIKTDWISVCIASMMFFVYYTELSQQMDSLTSLLNRKSLDYHLEHCSKAAAILFFDVDSFKSINDNNGHNFGDLCLIRISKQLKNSYGKFGLCYRYGGDEFCVILHRHLHHIEALNRAFEEALEHQRKFEKRLPTVSIGFATFDPRRERILECIKRADSMMYQNKHHD